MLSEARPVSQRGTRSLLELAGAEGRSWGVGFLVVDHSPSLLSHYVVENTGTKLVHLLGGEDVEVMRRVMDLSESSRRVFSELQVGEAMLLALRPFMLSGERMASRLRRVRLPSFARRTASNVPFADYLSHQATETVDLRRLNRHVRRFRIRC